jgi:hypothetical protein
VSLLLTLSFAPAQSCLRTKVDFFFANSTDEDSLDMFSTQAYLPFVECPIMLIHGSRDSIVPCSHAKFLYKLAVSARDKRWQLNDKRLKLKDKEEGVMIWLLETKMKRREAKLRRQKEMAAMWREAEAESTVRAAAAAPPHRCPPHPASSRALAQVLGTTRAPPPPSGPLSPQTEIARGGAAPSRLRSCSAPVDAMRVAARKSTQMQVRLDTGGVGGRGGGAYC